MGTADRSGILWKLFSNSDGFGVSILPFYTGYRLKVDCAMILYWMEIDALFLIRAYH